MYDKSKKTWSQRLKITKSADKPTTTATASVTTQQQQQLYQQQQQQQQQLQQSPTAMHLPATLQQINEYHHSGNGNHSGIVSAYADFSPSALSRSMKYAEPWIYGTVRGIPTRGPYAAAQGLYHHGYAAHPAAIFASHPMTTSELAIVICSCPEYLNGTKRDVKKASVCKRCKGSRLPLAQIGGTVRLHAASSTPHALKTRGVTGAATMRVVSSSKRMRPTILDPQQDPYDLMRRTRLLSPEPGNVTPVSRTPSEKSVRSRGKSASPVRGRTRTRPQLSIAPLQKSTTKKTEAAASINDCWLIEDPETLSNAANVYAPKQSNARRSILRCNVNPYDLISSNSASNSSGGATSLSSASASSSSGSNSSHASTPTPNSTPTPTLTPSPQHFLRKLHSPNEFLPYTHDDDFDVADAQLYDEAPPFAMRNNSGRSSGHSSKQILTKISTENDRNDGDYEEFENATLQDVVEEDDNTGSDGNHKGYTNVTAIAGQRISLGETNKSNKKSLIKQSEDGRIYESIIIAGDDETATKLTIVAPPAAQNTKIEVATEQPQRPPRSNKKIDVGEETSTPRATRRLSVASNSEISVTNISVTPPATAIKSILKRPANIDNVANEPKASAVTITSSSNANNSTNTNNSSNTQRRNRRRSGGGANKQHAADSTTATAAAAATTPTTTIATSQFYIPLPQARKKVQFMVEDNVIHVVSLPAEEHDSDNELEDFDDSPSKAQSNEINNDNNNVTIAVDEETTEFDEASTPTKSTLKSSTLNYEYYERKREQQKLLLQQQQQQHQEQNKQATASLAVTEGDSCNNVAAGKYAKAVSVAAANAEPETLNNEQQQSAFVAKSQLPFNLMSSAGVADDDDDDDGDDFAKINSNNNEHAIFNTKNSNSKQTVAADSVIKTSHFEDVNPAASCETNKTALLATGCAATMKPSDGFDGNDAKQRQQQQQQQHKQRPQKQQLLQAFVATDTLAESQNNDTTTINGNVNGNSTITVLSPLSRNPIRRSQSERHPGYNKKKLTNCSDEATLHMNAAIAQYNKSNNNKNTHSSSVNNKSSNTTILNFKDTMALRIKNIRQDSRDLFASNSTATAMTLLTSVRPREPPPPPPTTTSAIARAATLKAAAATAATARTTTKVSTKESKISDTFSSSSTSSVLTTTESLENASALLSPAGHTSQQQQQKQQQQDDRDNGLENHNEKQHKQQLEQPQQQEEQQPATTRKVLVIGGATTAAVADSVAPKNENHQHNGNNGAFCERGGINRATDTNIAIGKELKKDISENQNGPGAAATTKTNIVGTQTVTKIPLINSIASPQLQNIHLPKRPTSLPTHERTVVRVAPFNKNTSEVHRLKITHTDDNQQYSPGSVHSNGSPIILRADAALFDADSPLTAQKKTSILINGDDCYSTMNLSHDASTPLYQSSVVVTDHSVSQRICEGLLFSGTTNTVTINVSSPRRSPEEELIYQHNKLNTLLSRHTASNEGGGGRAIIPINGSANLSATEVSLQRSASSTSSASATSSSSALSSSSNSSTSGSGGATTKRGRTLIKLDYEKDKPFAPVLAAIDSSAKEVSLLQQSVEEAELFSHEAELVKILRNPVEAVRRNLVPHVCGRNGEKSTESLTIRNKKMTQTTQLEQPVVDVVVVAKAAVESNEATPALLSHTQRTTAKTAERNSFITKLLEDPMLGQVAEGLETETIVQLIENSLKRLKESRSALDTSGTKDNDDMTRLINISLQKIKEERQTAAAPPSAAVPTTAKEEDGHSNRGSISSANSFTSANNYEMFDFDEKSDSDCYQSCSSELTIPGDEMSEAATSTRSKFYQMLVDATLAEIENSTGHEEEDEHHYESIRHNGDPIYEEITDVPPPLPLSAPPLNDAELEKKAARSMFEGASKYDILSYLVDAKERGLVREEPFEYPVNCSNPIIIEEEAIDTLSDLGKRLHKSDPRDNSSSRASVMSDSSEDNQSTMSSLSPPPAHSFLGGGAGLLYRKGNSSEIERNDSGVGSETSKSSRSKYQHPLGTTTNMLLHKNSPIHLCEDCDGPVETQVTDSGVMFAPLVCRKCGKKRAERKEIITEIVETEEKYGRDLQIILEEFCQPMLVAGLLTQEQLSAIFLNTEDLLENNQTLAERMRDALDISLEQGDDDLLTVNIGRIVLDFTQMLHAFESYCVRQASASLLLANLEKEKELLRIFLKVSQMENTVLRRMNLNSFLMVPVQRVTKYPLLLARLYKVTPAHLEGRDLLKQAQEKIELHLNHINQEAKDVPTKLWRRISSSSPNRRASCEIDMINIKLRKMAIDVLEWNHDEVRFAMEGRLLYTQPTDSNWKKARTIKLTPVNALLVTNGKPSGNYKAEKATSDKLNFPKHNGIREASLLVVKEKCGRYTLIREPLYLDRCVVCSEADWDDYFEVQEISSKDTFIFKAEDGVRTKQWYTQLQYHAQGMGAWRKRRNALANIMINGMLARS